MKMAETYCFLQQSVELNNCITKCTPNNLCLHHNLCSFAETLLGQNTNTAKHPKMNPPPSSAPFPNYSVFLKIASFTHLTTQVFNFISTAAFTPNQRAG